MRSGQAHLVQHTEFTGAAPSFVTSDQLVLATRPAALVMGALTAKGRSSVAATAVMASAPTTAMAATSTAGVPSMAATMPATAPEARRRTASPVATPMGASSGRRHTPARVAGAGGDSVGVGRALGCGASVATSAAGPACSRGR